MWNFQSVGIFIYSCSNGFQEIIVFRKWHIHKSFHKNKSRQLAEKTPFLFLFVQKINHASKISTYRFEPIQNSEESYENSASSGHETPSQCSRFGGRKSRLGPKFYKTGITFRAWRLLKYWTIYIYIEIHPSSHNHGSVENGCITNMSFLSFRGPIFHWTMIMGERVVWYSGVACTNSWRVLGSTLCATSTITSVYFCYLYVNRVSCIRYDISLMLTNQLGIWNNMPENAVNFRKTNKEPPWSHRKHRILLLQSTFRKHYKMRMCVLISVHICRRSLNPGCNHSKRCLPRILVLWWNICIATYLPAIAIFTGGKQRGRNGKGSTARDQVENNTHF